MTDEVLPPLSENSPPWTAVVLNEIEVRYPPGPYKITNITDQPMLGGFDVDVVDRSSAEETTFSFEGWIDEIDSLRDGGRPAVEAFALLLHAHLDEYWSDLGR